MSMKKKTFTYCVALSFLMPLYVTAADLTIINNTNHDSTSLINNGACSDILGANGITRAHSTNVVPESVIAKGCITNKRNCQANVHMTSNCTGPAVATVLLDVKTGIKSVTPSGNTQGYVVSGNGFTASIDGGPAIQKNWFQRLFGL